ncbi:hypothetical protein [Brevibacterium sp. FME17]|uniref:hypothetical protein n=1 Tax=Brevibacterium sp. FME17 TaxID=2742606 RepID=UPI001867B6B1|nr:hypothetical protein [Brevibacterium sp. FME17]
MDDYTADGSIWINAGGMITCLNHGGGYLQTAVKNGEGPRIITPLDDWEHFTAEVAAEHGHKCESCTFYR